MSAVDGSSSTGPAATASGMHLDTEIMARIDRIWPGPVKPNSHTPEQGHLPPTSTAPCEGRQRKILSWLEFW